MKHFLLIALVAFALTSFAQETNNGKKIWAKSILNEKAPRLMVEKWISSKPELEGKFVLIDFWATWCGPCRVYIPTLNGLHTKFADKLVVIGLSDETEDKVKKFNNPKINYFEAIDTRARTKGELKVTGIPHAVLIDPNGIVRWEGFPLLTGGMLTEEIIVALMEKYKVRTPVAGSK